MKDIDRFYNIVLSPPLIGSTKHRLLLQKSVVSEKLRHYRFIDGNLSTCVTEIEPIVENNSNVNCHLDQAVYGGILWHNYGHVLAETIHRLWVYWSKFVSFDIPVVFHTVSQTRGQEYIKPFMIDIFKYLGIAQDKIVLIDQSIHFSEIIIPQQGKLWGKPGPIEYNDSFADLTCGDHRFKFIYVSRSRYLQSGSFLGEAIFEQHLQKFGFKVIYPEEWSIKDLVGMYRHASKIVFSEGSPLHVMEITGGSKADVFIICRRSVNFVEKNFGSSIRPLCKSLTLMENTATLPSMYWDVHNSRPTLSLASAFVDINNLVKSISQEIDVVIPFIDSEILATAIRSDLVEIIFHKYLGKIPDEILGRLMKNMAQEISHLGITG